MVIRVRHISTWFYLVYTECTEQHERWAALLGATYHCIFLQRNLIITQQKTAANPIFTVSTIYPDSGAVLMLSKLFVVGSKQLVIKYLEEIAPNLRPRDAAKMLSASDSDLTDAAAELALRTDFKSYQHVGHVLQKEYATLLLHSFLYTRCTLLFLFNSGMLPGAIAAELRKFLKPRQSLTPEDIPANAKMFVKISKHFAIISLVPLHVQPYSERLCNVNSSFVLGTGNPYVSLLHISRGINQVLPADSTRLTTYIKRLSKSAQKWLALESGSALSLRIISGSSVDKLTYQYPQLNAYPQCHYLLLPSIIPINLPFWNINRVFPILTDQYVAPSLPEALHPKNTLEPAGSAPILPTTFSLRPSQYIELPRYPDNKTRAKSRPSIWLSQDTQQPLSQTGRLHAAYAVLASAFSVHTLHASDAKAMLSRAKTMDAQLALCSGQGRLAVDVSPSGIVLGDIGTVVSTSLSPANGANTQGTGFYSVAEAAIPSYAMVNEHAFQQNDAVLAAFVGERKVPETISIFPNRPSVLEQQFAVVHGTFDEYFVAITVGAPAHTLSNTNVFYCLSSEDSWRSYQLECFRYWQGKAPYSDTDAEKALANYELILEQHNNICVSEDSEANATLSVKHSKRALKQYTAIQKAPLPITSLTKKVCVVDGHLMLQQQVILYNAVMQKRFALSAGYIYTTVKQNYSLLNIRVLRIDAAQILTCGHLISVLILIEDLNLPMNKYLSSLAGSITFTRQPKQHSLPHSTVYHCLFTCDLNGHFIGIQPLLLGGLGHYYDAGSTDAFKLTTLGLPSGAETDTAPRPVNVPFNTIFLLYTGRLVSSSYTYLLSDVTNIAASIDPWVYVCLKNLHSVLHLNVVTGERYLIGSAQRVSNPYTTKFTTTFGVPLPIFANMSVQSILLSNSGASTVLGALLSDHTDTDGADLPIQRADQAENDLGHEPLAVYTIEESDDIRTPGYCTDTSEGEMDSHNKEVSSPYHMCENIRLAFSPNISRYHTGQSIFKPNSRAVTYSSHKYGVMVVRDNKVLTFPYNPVAVSRYRFKKVDLIAVIGEGRNRNYWAFMFTECLSKGVHSLVRQMVIDLGAPFVTEATPVISTSSRKDILMSTGRRSTASISCTGDSFVFAVPAMAPAPGMPAVNISVTRLVEVGFYTELRQIAEVAGLHRVYTPAQMTSRQLLRIEDCEE